MKLRRLLECGLVSGALIIASAAAISGNVTDTSQSSHQIVSNENYAQKKVATTMVYEKTVGTDSAGSASVQSAVADSGATDTAEQNGQPEQMSISSLVSQDSKGLLLQLSANQGLEEETEVAIPADQEEENSEWDKKLMADVDDYLCIRSKPDSDSKLVGKLYKGSAAEFKKKGSKWTKITSGSVHGYVKNEYCAFGDDAEKLAEKTCSTYAKSSTDGLRVREKEDSDSKIVDVLEKGESLKVVGKDDGDDGWITVKYDGEKAFVADDYVKVGLKTGKAVSIKADQSHSSTGTAYSASTSEVRMLAAIIECEAGGESYSGKVAVGAVVINRVQSSHYPDNIAGVIAQSGQFSPVASGKYSRMLAKGASSSCVSAAKAALNGADNTGGAMHFHAGASGYGQVIGNQTFY